MGACEVECKPGRECMGVSFDVASKDAAKKCTTYKAAPLNKKDAIKANTICSRKPALCSINNYQLNKELKENGAIIQPRTGGDFFRHTNEGACAVECTNREDCTGYLYNNQEGSSGGWQPCWLFRNSQPNQPGYPLQNICTKIKPKNENPVCDMYENTVWAFCGNNPVKRWGIGPEGKDAALGNCNYAATYEGSSLYGLCPPGTQKHTPGSDDSVKWVEKPGMDFPFNDLPNNPSMGSTLQECQQACAEDSKCKGIVYGNHYNTEGNQCFKKSVMSGTGSPASGFNSYVKQLASVAS